MFKLLQILAWSLLCGCFPLSASVDPKIITVESGQNITLTCRAPNNNITNVEWRRTDRGDEYVFLYRTGKPVEDMQNQSFKTRVDLKDGQMKDGDVSLILKNVTTNDIGRYECHFPLDSSDFTCIIYLSVSPGQTGGHTEDGGKEDGGKEDGVSRGRFGLIAIPSIFVVMVFVVLFVRLRPA